MFLRDFVQPVSGMTDKDYQIRQKCSAQMDRDSPCSEVIDSKHATNDISSHIIEDQDLPNRVAILVQYRSRDGDKTVCRWIKGSIFCGLQIMI